MRHNGLEHLLFPRVRDRDKAKDKDEDPKSTNNAPQNRPDSSRNETQADYATQQKEKLRQEVPRHQGGSNVFRKLLLMTVLATDLSVHGEFMRRYDRMLVERNEPSGESAVAEGPGPGGGKPGPEDELFERKMLLCQALIKCADISNPVRSSIFITMPIFRFCVIDILHFSFSVTISFFSFFLLSSGTVSPLFCFATLGSGAGVGME